MGHHLDLGEQWVPEAIGVEEHRGLAEIAQLVPGEDLEDLVERAEATRERDERVGEFGHSRLAGMHRLDDDQPAQTLVGNLERNHRLGDHPDHLSAASKRRIGDDSHKTHVAAAVDESDPTPGQF